MTCLPLLTLWHNVLCIPKCRKPDTVAGFVQAFNMPIPSGAHDIDSSWTPLSSQHSLLCSLLLVAQPQLMKAKADPSLDTSDAKRAEKRLATELTSGA
jgi:hypothetical protein